jgi:threonine/homoserine/homoserine lactone efflux protein
MALLEGYLIGLSMVVFLGPVFFTLLQSTLQHGIKIGFAIVAGIIMSDVLVVMLCSYGTQSFFLHPKNQFWLALVGSVVLFFMGAKYILKPNYNCSTTLQPSVFTWSGFFVKGFAVNFINPFVFMVWIATITYAESTYKGDNETIIFLLAALLGILTTDSLKVLLASKLTSVLQPVVLRKLFIVIGLILIGFGCRLLYFCWM